MYVPDPGLMAKIDNLLKETGEFFMDCRVIFILIRNFLNSTKNFFIGSITVLDFCPPPPFIFVPPIPLVSVGQARPRP